jgi:hypothetical protein
VRNDIGPGGDAGVGGGHRGNSEAGSCEGGVAAVSWWWGKAKGVELEWVRWCEGVRGVRAGDVVWLWT